MKLNVFTCKLVTNTLVCAVMASAAGSVGRLGQPGQDTVYRVSVRDPSSTGGSQKSRILVSSRNLTSR